MTTTPSVPKHLNFITGNRNKLAEVQAILSGVIDLRSQSLDLVEIQGTVEEVTKDKCRRAAEAVSLCFHSDWSHARPVLSEGAWDARCSLNQPASSPTFFFFFSANSHLDLRCQNFCLSMPEREGDLYILMELFSARQSSVWATVVWNVEFLFSTAQTGNVLHATSISAKLILANRA
jgi:hypothetical protein